MQLSAELIIDSQDHLLVAWAVRRDPEVVYKAVREFSLR